MKHLIVNADDFGYGPGVNRGVVECLDRGIVTSAGLMVNTVGTLEAVRLAAERPHVSLGLHVNFTNEAQRLVDFDDPEVCRTELRRQLDRFLELVGRPPTHLDSHQHVHRRPACLPSFREAASELGLPLRDNGPVIYKGGFYAQWEYGVTDPSKVSVEALERILRDEVTDGVSELGVHPGLPDVSERYVYGSEREIEVRTLCAPRVREVLAEAGIRLVSYRDLPTVLSPARFSA